MKRTRLWLILGGLLVVVVVLSIVMQAINSLIWQLSYWLPGWLVGPILLLLVGARLIIRDKEGTLVKRFKDDAVWANLR